MKQTAILFLSSIIFLACGKDYTSDLDIIKAADPTIPLETTRLNESTPDGTPFIANISEGDQKNQADQKVIPMMNVPTFGYYKLPDNSQPIFSESCLGTPDPSSCSVEMLKEWLHDQLKNAEIDLKRGEVSIQYVLFEINENGEVLNVRHAGSDGNAICWSCVNIALETVEKMPDWVPAMKSGKPIKASLKLPVRFMVI